jgi:tight adherence protein B
MRAKIHAMSTEAKTSAGIIGSLPFIVTILMKLSAPAYIDTIFTTFAGNVIIAACVAWMMVGVFVMWKMIRFDF